MVLNTNHNLLSDFLFVYHSVSTISEKLPKGKFWVLFAFSSQELFRELAFNVVYKKCRLEWRNSVDQSDNYFVGIELKCPKAQSYYNEISYIDIIRIFSNSFQEEFTSCNSGQGMGCILSAQYDAWHFTQHKVILQPATLYSGCWESSK